MEQFLQFDPVLHLDQALMPSVLLTVAALLALPQISALNQAVRTVAVAITVLIGVRYLWWRWAATLPPLSDDPNTVWMWFFFALEALALINTWFTALLLSRHADRSPEAAAGAARLEAEQRYPSVDVLIATYNEGPDILERTIIGARAIDYPNFTVWVLDDGRRPWLASLCKRLGVRCVTRPDNRHAKAGNINHALATVCRSEFVLVLDADFVAQPQILRRTIGLFDDPRIGAVQTPQVFFNPDPIQHNLRAASSCVDEQRFFFDVLQPAKDAWDTAMCCGTGAVLRRRALDAIGGFPTETVTEDIHLTFRFYDHGWITRYLNEPLNTGMAAEGVSEYLIQRSRWCLGAVQQLFLRSGPFGFNRQSLWQRLNFLNGAMFWILFGQKLLFLVSPLLFWFQGVPTLIASSYDLLFWYLPTLVTSWAMLAWISRGAILPLLTDATQLLAAAVITRTVGQALAKPFGQPFKVTPKGGDHKQTVIHWGVVVPSVILIGLLAAGMVLNSRPDQAVVDLEVRGVNILWSFANIILLIVTLFLAIDLPRPRREERFEINEDTTVRIAAGPERPARLLDLSVGGARVHYSGPVPDGSLVTVAVPGVGPVTAVKTNGKSGPVYALRFPMLEQKLREKLIQKLYTGGYESVAHVARSGDLLGALLRRALG